MSALDLLEPLLTSEVKKIARERLISGNALVREKHPLAKADAINAKLALLLVRIINPFESLTKAEEAHLRGMTDERFRSARQNHEFALQP